MFYYRDLILRNCFNENTRLNDYITCLLLVYNHIRPLVDISVTSRYNKNYLQGEWLVLVRQSTSTRHFLQTANNCGIYTSMSLCRLSPTNRFTVNIKITYDFPRVTLATRESLHRQ